MRIFLDANILFSAAKSAGPICEMLARARAAGHVLCVDAYVEAEARRNLEIKEPAALPALDALIASVERAAYRPGALPPKVAALLPEKDQPMLAAAISMKCGALVTGDRMHFGALYGRVVHGVAIHSPRTLADAIGLSDTSP
jgi:hypothetical protein